MSNSIILNASSRIMHETALKMGVSCTLIGDNDTILMEKDGVQWYTRGSRTSSQSSVGKSIADKKDLTKLVLHHFNLPTAKSVKVNKEEQLHLIESLHFPIVMKPVAERHGKGVVVGIKNGQEANELYVNSDFKDVIFEEQLQGIEYRIVCVDYTFVAAAFRKPAHVVGDGVRSIEELVAEKNKHPWRGTGHTANLTLIAIDDVVKKNLLEKGFEVTSVPEKDQEVFLRKTANLSTGGEAWDVTSQVCPENRVMFEKIAKACDLNVAGIDIMCNSLETPLTEQPKAGVIEVNASPGLRMHHYPIQGEPQNVAEKILEMVLRDKKK